MFVELAGLGFWLVAAVWLVYGHRRNHRPMDGFMKFIKWDLVAGALLMTCSTLWLGGVVWIRSVLAGVWVSAAVGLIIASRTIGRVS